MRTERMTPTEEVFEELISHEILDVSKAFGIEVLVAVAIMGKVMGRMTACLDETIKENEEFRQTVVVKGQEVRLSGADSHDFFMKNYETMRRMHLALHARQQKHGEAVADEMLNKILGK